MVELRRAMPDDAGFLFQVFRETNKATFEVLGSELCEMLLKQQSALQESQYAAQHPLLERFIIWSNGTAVGRLYLDRDDDELALVNIAVCPAFQKAGIGTRVLQDLVGEAKVGGKAVRLHVAQDNPAVAWYLRHGFTPVGLKEPYVEMVLDPV